MRISKILESAAIAAVLALGVWVLTWNLTAPLNGWHEWNSAMYGVHARNHIAWGLGVTKGLCTWGVSAEPPAQPDYYLNHPPLISLWAAGAILIFGDHEAALRSVPIAATLGSALVLWRMLRRLAGAGLGVVAAYFFLLLPATAYFGRMLDHVAPAQFFSLLMLHGYLLRSGWYAERAGPSSMRVADAATSPLSAAPNASIAPAETARGARLGLALYLVGVLLGVGTGWVAALMGALITFVDVARCIVERRGWSRLSVTAVAPLAALAGVVLHIGWARGWDFSQFLPMFLSRALGNEHLESPALSIWLQRQAEYWISNYTWWGAGAAILYLVFVVAGRARGGRRTSVSGQNGDPSTDAVVLARRAVVVPILLCAAQGLLYVLLLRERAHKHIYWQIFFAPFVAAAGASIVVAAFRFVRSFGGVQSGVAAGGGRGGYAWRIGAGTVGAALLAAPVFADLAGLRSLHDHLREIPIEYIDAYRALAARVPWRAPVLVSRGWPQESEQFGTYINRWTMPTIAYYANRPLIVVRGAEQVRARRGDAAAYLHEVRPNDLSDMSLIAELRQEFQAVPVGRQHIIFLLR